MPLAKERLTYDEFMRRKFCDAEFDKRKCTKHGITEFKRMKACRGDKKFYHYTCYKCLKEKWRVAQDKKRKKPGSREYHRNKTIEHRRFMKNVSFWVTALLYALEEK